MKPSELTWLAIDAVKRSTASFCKFISANDAGKTGAHQEGFYIPKNAWPLIFDEPGVRGSNKDRIVKIKWQNSFETDSRFIYYGVRTRNEYRLTRFGRGFGYLEDDNVGDLIILCRIEKDYYEGYILQRDDDIDTFFAAFNMSSEQTNRLIDKDALQYTLAEKLKELFDRFMAEYADFPETADMSRYARDCYRQVHRVTDQMICANPDQQLIEWIDTEYELFKAFENRNYLRDIKNVPDNAEDRLRYFNSMLNRRKSRAGKSLEYHLSNIFTINQLKFESQVKTEGKKKPDFIFPDGRSYHNFDFPGDKLICLGAKTTCKDRWRQVINEADRVPVKHLFTLQQGISKNQLQEMYDEHVCLVVPKPYLNSFDKSFHDRIMTLGSFNQYVKATQA